jgi:hypothetical protein
MRQTSGFCEFPDRNLKNEVRVRFRPLASNSKLHFCNGLQMPEEASARESASEIITELLLNHYPGNTRQSRATTDFGQFSLCPIPPAAKL